MSPGETIDRADLVLGGGGVRGIAHVGAYSVLVEHDVEVRRVAGASAGALAGALIAARTPPEVVQSALRDISWGALTVSDLLGRLTGTPVIGSLVGRLREGRAVDPLSWIRGLLAEQGVDTWADLRLDDPEPWIHPAERYRLVVRSLDVVNRRTVRLPWDYHRYGLDPDQQPVAEAVRASMAVPLVFDPVRLGERGRGGGLLIDGGLAAGFGVDVLDRRDGRPPRHPTIGLQLLQRPEPGEDPWPSSDLALARAVLQTMIDTGNDMHPVGECDEARTIALDTAGVRTLDFGLSAREETRLFEVGADAMRDFLRRWDHEEHVRRCRGG